MKAKNFLMLAYASPERYRHDYFPMAIMSASELEGPRAWKKTLLDNDYAGLFATEYCGEGVPMSSPLLTEPIYVGCLTKYSMNSS